MLAIKLLTNKKIYNSILKKIYIILIVKFDKRYANNSQFNKQSKKMREFLLSKDDKQLVF